MALPKLNSTPSYKTKLPSTGQVLSYRPYLVKEEKVLMIAIETGDQKQALMAIVDTIKACIEEELNINELTTFDIEYLFTQIRSKSVGEVATILLPCTECETKNEVDVVLSEVEVKMTEQKNVIELTPNISVEMKYPSYVSVLDIDPTKQEIESGFSILVDCISAILTEEERIDARDVSKKELLEFIEEMTSDQFKKLSEFLQNVPSLQKDVEYDCVSCGTHNTRTLQGISDFLS